MLWLDSVEPSKLQCWSFCRWYVSEKRILVNTWGSDSYFYWQWEGFRCSYSFQIVQRLNKYEKKIVTSDPARYETWKLSHNRNLNYTGSSPGSHNCNLNYAGSSPGMETGGATKTFSSSKRSMDYIALLFMEMVTARHILLSEIYMIQVNLLRSLNVSVTIKNVSVRGFVIWKKRKMKRKTH